MTTDVRRFNWHPGEVVVEAFAEEPQVFTDAGDPEWKTVHRIAESQETLLAEAIVAAFAAARRGINEDTVALELMAHGNTGEIDWAALSKRLSDALASSIRKCATQTALALLPRLRAEVEPVMLSEPWQFWANNAVKGKKGFQPTNKGGVDAASRESWLAELPPGMREHFAGDSSDHSNAEAMARLQVNAEILGQPGPLPPRYGYESLTKQVAGYLKAATTTHAATLAEPLTVYRGMSKSLANRYKKGPLTEATYTYVSTSRAMAQKYAGSRGVLLEVRLPAGTKFAHGWSDQHELILPTGSKFSLSGEALALQFDEPMAFWANNAVVGKKGFQPTGGDGGGAAGGGGEQVVSKDWSAPPPPIGKAGEHKAGGYSSDSAYGTNTALGRVGEKAFVEVAGGKILHAPGKGEQSPLDVRIDGYGFEVKAVSTLSTKYAATPKPYEIAQKEAYAKTLGVKPATAIVVVDSIGGQAHAYWRPGLATGRLSENTGWKYLGSTSLAEQHTETFADPVEQAFLSLSLVLRYSAAEDYLRTHLPTLVANITRETQEAIRDTILDGFQVGKHPRVMARQIKTMVGLTGPQGRTLDRLINTWLGAKIPRANLDSNVRRTVDKMIRYRALNIARTETLRASNAGQQALWAAATNEGLLQRGVTRREWIATPSDRTCPFCMALDGIKVGMNEAWHSDRGDVTMPPLHPSCRCAMGIAIDPEAKPEPAPDYVRDFDQLYEAARKGKDQLQVRPNPAGTGPDIDFSAWGQSWMPQPNRSQESSIKAYSGNEFRQINSGLRFAKDSYLPGSRSGIDNIEDAMRPISEDMIVRRGTTGSAFTGVPGAVPMAPGDWRRIQDLAPAVGQTITDWGFLSTTLRESGFEDHVNLKILAPKGTRAFHMNAYDTSSFPSEEELLFARGTRLRIVRVERRDVVRLGMNAINWDVWAVAEN